MIPHDLAKRLHRKARADRWSVSIGRFTAALEASAVKAPGGETAAGDARTLERFLDGLHLEDMALACACADGDESAWEHFIREHRPVLYRAADALEAGGGAREIADSLYADLYGTRGPDDDRRSLFRYFHGRSSLATWLRAVLAQRHVDAIRARRRLDPLPPEDTTLALVSPAPPPADPDRPRYLALIQRALRLAVTGLPPRDRLRLASYYVQGLTLAQIGKLLGEHEATASRHLARTRRTIREGVERHLSTEAGLQESEVARCFEYVLEDAGPVDLSAIIRKDSESDRSI